MSFSIGGAESAINTTIGGALGNATKSLSALYSNFNSAPYQQFSTEAVTNTQVTLYALYLISPAPASKAILKYIFPLSPRMLKQDNLAMSSMYNVAGAPYGASPGVQRIVDQYGIAPVIFSIEGTTGWQKHSADGNQYTGLQSLTQLIGIINAYFSLNQELMAQQQTELYTLEFYDFFLGNYWEIDPLGPQFVTQDVAQPLLVNYNFKWVGVRPVSKPVSPPSPTDSIANMFEAAFAVTGLSVLNSASSVVSSYQNLSGGPF